MPGKAKKKRVVVEEPQEQELPYGYKRLTVEILEGIPKFQFFGNWSGRDLDLITRLLRRSYIRHQRTVRRSETITTHLS